jgi:DNA replication and repair protein RecF
MLGGLRGIRGATMDELARFTRADNPVAVGNWSRIANLSDDTDISLSWNYGDAARRAKIDGDNAPLSDLANILRIIWLTPREDRLLVDDAAPRRAFFDRRAGTFDDKHIGRVARLAKLLSERTFALKSRRDENWLRGLDEQIASTAVAVSATRIQYAGEINYFLETSSVSVAGMLESLIICDGAGRAEKQYLNYLANNRTLCGDKMIIDGTHKSDFIVFNKLLNLPAHITSTGQQKSVLIDLIVGMAKLIHVKTNKTPIILLDEADAHLDPRARADMFAKLMDANAQVWATGINKNIFDNLLDAVFIELTIDNG